MFSFKIKDKNTLADAEDVNMNRITSNTAGLPKDVM